MRTSNPVFNSPTYQQAPGLNTIPLVGLEDSARRDVMTVRSTAIKTALLVGITIIVAAISWNFFMNKPGAIMGVAVGSVIGGLIGAFIMVRKPTTAPFLAPVFAVGEGAFVAAISVSVVAYSPLADHVGGEAAGLALVAQAAGLTMAIALAMLTGYATGVLRFRGVAKKIIIVLTAGVAVYYIGAWVINMIMGPVVPRLGWDAGPIGIGFSVFVVVLASLNLVLDFQFVEDGAEKGLPKHYEWLAAFGILTTLVWLYVELLRLLAKLRR